MMNALMFDVLSQGSGPGPGVPGGVAAQSDSVEVVAARREVTAAQRDVQRVQETLRVIDTPEGRVHAVAISKSYDATLMSECCGMQLAAMSIIRRCGVYIQRIQSVCFPFTLHSYFVCRPRFKRLNIGCSGRRQRWALRSYCPVQQFETWSVSCFFFWCNHDADFLADSPGPCLLLSHDSHQTEGVAVAEAKRIGDLKDAVLEADLLLLFAIQTRFGASNQVQEAACLALRELSVGRDDTDARTAAQLKHFMIIGGLELVFNAMDIHSTYPGVQEAACGVLRNLAFHADDSGANIVSGGGLDRVLSAMRAHLASASVQQAACDALGNFALNEDSRASIGSTGGLEAVYAVMATHLMSPGVQETACGALGTLALNHAENKASVVSAGLVHIYAAMGAHVASADVQQEACMVLWSLLQDAACVPLLKAGGIAAALVRTAMAAHPTVSSVQLHGTFVLSKLA